jgi:hypothetical protein
MHAHVVHDVMNLIVQTFAEEVAADAAKELLAGRHASTSNMMWLATSTPPTHWRHWMRHDHAGLGPSWCSSQPALTQSHMY